MADIFTNQTKAKLARGETVYGCAIRYQVPWVNSADDAERAVAAVTYGPRGKRGLSGSRVNRFGQVPFSDYVRRANEETLVIVQIESGDAVDRIDEIVAVPDVDVVFIGSTDLAQDLGFVGQP